MSDRVPVILVVLIDTGKLSWHLGGIRLDGEPVPLLKSARGDLDSYRGLETDHQVSFLRHRLAGALQRGCDRLFSHRMKASHFVFVADGTYPHAADDVTERLADHFVQWMMNPPVTYMLSPDGVTQAASEMPKVIAGTLPEDVAAVLKEGLPKLARALNEPDRWECVPQAPAH
ncbi:MAG: hypothetical protein ACO1RT_09700 [Planctomycetaceae bacterium]